ncbi:MAG: DUF2191 domain-containing protein, partial [Acidimicrobiales bacterium]
VAAGLRSLARERDISFKEAINQAVRRGLKGDVGAAQRYTMPSRDMGLRPGIDLDRALGLVSELEDEEIVRKLGLRK